MEHRSYERRDINKIPSIHIGVAASQMEQKGNQAKTRNTDRQIAEDSKVLKEIRIRI